MTDHVRITYEEQDGPYWKRVDVWELPADPALWPRVVALLQGSGVRMKHGRGSELAATQKLSQKQDLDAFLAFCDERVEFHTALLRIISQHRTALRELYDARHGLAEAQARIAELEKV